MKIRHPFTLKCIALSLGLSLAAFTNPASAGTYYWDENDVTAGFGTAGTSGTSWTSSTSLFSSDSTGATSPVGTVVTGTGDSVNFGTGTVGLGAGTLNVGMVSVGNIGFGSASGAITLASGTITLAAAQTTTVDNASDTISSALAGAGTSFTKNGTGALNLSGGGTIGGNLVANSGALNVTAGTLNFAGAFSKLGSLANTTAVASTSSGATFGWTGANGGQFGAASGASAALYNSGIFNQSATTLNNAGIYLGNAATAYGYLRSSGTTTIAGRLWIAQAGNAAGATGVLDVTGGMVSVNPTGNFTAGQRLQINGDNTNHTTSTSYAGVNISSGTLAVGGATAQTNIGGNTSTKNTYTSFNITGSGKFTAGTGDAGIGLGVTSDATNIATLSVSNGGTLETSYIYGTNTAGTSVLNLDNATVRALATNAQGLIQGSNIKAYLYSGGVTFDSNGFNPNITTPLLAPSGNGITNISLGGTVTGYVGAPVVKISGGGGTGAAAVANFDPTTGTVTGITITAAGSGYTSAPTITLVGGNGGSTGAGIGTATATASIGAVAGGGLTKSGLGNLTLSGTNTYSGQTNVNTGTLTLNGINNGTGLVTVASGATLAGTGTLGGASVINGALAGSLTLNNDATVNSGATAAAAAFNGNIANNGTITSAVTVASGKALSGNGTFSSNLTVNGTLTPGASGIGTPAISGSLAFGGSAQLSIVLGKTTAGAPPVAGSDYGQVSVGGNVSLNGILALTINAGVEAGDVFYLIVNNGATSTTSGAFSGFMVNGSTMTLDANNQFTYNGQQYALSSTADFGGTGFNSASGNDVAIAAVPEPGTWAMILGGLGMLVSFQRSRRRK